MLIDRDLAQNEHNNVSARYNKEHNLDIEKYQFLHHFLPHPHHKSRAKLLSHKALSLYALFILVLFATVQVIPKVFPGVLGYASNINVVEVFEQTNKKRVENGESALIINPALSKAAEEKAKHMFSNNYWAHVAPDGTEPWKFILDEDYDYSYAGENLAKNFNSSREVVEAWMNSPSHKQNLLSSNYDEIGFAVVDGILDGYETTLVVQMFGRPRDSSKLISLSEQERLLEAYASEPNLQPITVQIPSAQARVLPAVDVSKATKWLSLSFLAFILLLLGLDVWYSKRKGILKFTGHTVAHITLLVIVVLGVLFALSPGTIL